MNSALLLREHGRKGAALTKQAIGTEGCTAGSATAPGAGCIYSLRAPFVLLGNPGRGRADPGNQHGRGGNREVMLNRMDYLWTPWRYSYVTGADKAGERVGVPPQLAAWPGDHHCVFCNLHLSAGYAAGAGMNAIEADRAAKIVLRGQHCFVCLNAFPYSSGHVMVIPYAHEQSLAALADPAAQEMMMLARRTETVLRAVYAPHGINLGMNLGKAAGAGVDDHLHLHALPRWLGDTNFMTVTAETRVLPETLELTWDRLHAAFQSPPG